jgi:integrase/recombinase XerD
MTAIAPTVQAFFTDRLTNQLRASPHTITSYRDTMRLLLTFACQQRGKEPSKPDFTDLDAPAVGAFLTHLETTRRNGVTTRNARLTAIRSLFRYASLHVPEHAELISRVLAIPGKRHDHPTACFLTRDEISALLAAPDPATWAGRRDHALLLVAVQAGLRVSELTGLTVSDAAPGTGPHVTCHGKGRKERATPLTPATAAVLRDWLAERGGTGTDPLFPSRRGTRLSRDAVERLLTKHAAAATRTCPSIAAKHITPHVLRHSAAMALLHAGAGITVIALWLGHESPATTRVYLNPRELHQTGEKPQVA